MPKLGMLIFYVILHMIVTQGFHTGIFRGIVSFFLPGRKLFTVDTQL
jgi:hypothetical protein